MRALDVQPPLALGARLMARGHTVSRRATDFGDAATRPGLPWVPVGESITRFLARLSDERGDLVPRRVLAANLI